MENEIKEEYREFLERLMEGGGVIMVWGDNINGGGSVILLELKGGKWLEGRRRIGRER